MKRIFGVMILSVCIFLIAACGKTTEEKWQEQYDLGMKYLDEQNYEEAIVAFTAAIEIDPKQADTYIALSDIYIDNDEFDKAVDVLSSALRMTENVNKQGENNEEEIFYQQLEEIYMQLADVYEKQDMLQEAIKILNDALEIHFTENIYQKNYKLRIQHIEALFSSMEENLSYHVLTGKCYEDFDQDGYEELFAEGREKTSVGTVKVHIWYCDSDKSACEEIGSFEIPAGNGQTWWGTMGENPAFYFFSYGSEEIYAGYYVYGVSDEGAKLLQYETEINVPENELQEYIETNLIGSRETE